MIVSQQALCELNSSTHPNQYRRIVMNRKEKLLKIWRRFGTDALRRNLATVHNDPLLEEVLRELIAEKNQQTGALNNDLSQKKAGWVEYLIGLGIIALIYGIGLYVSSLVENKISKLFLWAWPVLLVTSVAVVEVLVYLTPLGLHLIPKQWKRPHGIRLQLLRLKWRTGGMLKSGWEYLKGFGQWSTKKLGKQIVPTAQKWKAYGGLALLVLVVLVVWRVAENYSPEKPVGTSLLSKALITLCVLVPFSLLVVIFRSKDEEKKSLKVSGNRWKKSLIVLGVIVGIALIGVLVWQGYEHRQLVSDYWIWIVVIAMILVLAGMLSKEGERIKRVVGAALVLCLLITIWFGGLGEWYSRPSAPARSLAIPQTVVVEKPKEWILEAPVGKPELVTTPFGWHTDWDVVGESKPIHLTVYTDGVPHNIGPDKMRLDLSKDVVVWGFESKEGRVVKIKITQYKLPKQSGRSITPTTFLYQKTTER